MSPDPLLEISGLSLAFSDPSGPREVLSDVSFTLNRGEVMALVGESGSGKTMTALSVTRLLPAGGIAWLRGRILFQGRDVLAAPETELRQLRGGKIAYVFQEPMTALNPVFSVCFQITEALRLHRKSSAGESAVRELLEAVGLRDSARVAAAYPHQLSGGQQQRVMLAMALAGEPDLLIADEPTTALDVTVQAQILELLREIQQRRGMSVLLITHNLSIAKRLADRITVMYAGQIVESGPAPAIIAGPHHPYTAALLKAVPKLRGERQALRGIPGQVPAHRAWPPGCRFAPRCSMAEERCRRENPSLAEAGASRQSRCFFADRMVPS